MSLQKSMRRSQIAVSTEEIWKPISRKMPRSTSVSFLSFIFVIALRRIIVSDQISISEQDIYSEQYVAQRSRLTSTSFHKPSINHWRNLQCLEGNSSAWKGCTRGDHPSIKCPGDGQLTAVQITNLLVCTLGQLFNASEKPRPKKIRP